MYRYAGIQWIENGWVVRTHNGKKNAKMKEVFFGEWDDVVAYLNELAK